MPTYLENGVGISGGSSLIGGTGASENLTLDSTSSATKGSVILNGPLKVNVGSDATGDMYYRNSGGAFVRLPIGANGRLLSVIGGVPAWAYGLVTNDNTILGSSAGPANTGSNNVFLGSYSGGANAAGSDNVFTGHESGRVNTIGNANTFLGSKAGYNNTTGNENTLIGVQSGFNLTTGAYNVFIGGQNGASITTGSGNTAIGTFTNFSSNVNNATAIGSGAVANGNTSTAIGCSAIATGDNILALGGTGGYAVSVGIGTASPAYTLDVVGTMHSTGNALIGGTLATTGLLSANGNMKVTVGSDATGDMYYRGSGGSFSRVGIGSFGQVLTAGSAAPVWRDSQDVAPYGSFLFMAAETAPDEYLRCDGSSLDRSNYPELFAVIGTIYGSVNASSFNLPDSRGLFFRDLDSGAGIDPSRTLGSYQADQFKEHYHTYIKPTTDGSATGNAVSHPDGPLVGANTGLAGGPETRPKNIPIVVYIKAGLGL